MDNNELQQLIDAHYAQIRRAAMGLCHDPWEADEIAQETFLAAYRGIHKLRQHSAANVWLYGICIRIHRSRLRAWVRRARRAALWLNQAQHVPCTSSAYRCQVEHQQWRAGIWGCVSRLPAVQREVIVLKFAENMTQAQIAVVLQCSEGTVKSRLHYGLRRLQELLDHDGEMKCPQSCDKYPDLPEQLLAEIFHEKASSSK